MDCSFAIIISTVQPDREFSITYHSIYHDKAIKNQENPEIYFDNRYHFVSDLLFRL